MKTIINILLTALLLSVTTEAQAQESHWACNTNDYQYDMVAYLTLAAGSNVIDNLSDYEIAAFSGDECRGVGKVLTAEKEGQFTTYCYLRIRSNKMNGEDIGFKVYKRSWDAEADISGTSITFVSMDAIGMPSAPKLLDLPDAFTCQTNVSYDEDKGTVSGGGPVGHGSTVTLTATPNTGYHFVKWSDETSANPYILTVTDNLTLSAEFAPNQHTMTFVLDNGEENVEKTQDYGTELTAPEDLVKTGFTFKGWEPEVPATIPAGDQTFTAQWERNKYKLTFVVDGVETITEVLYEDPITKPEDPEEDGYTFTGWTPEVPETMPAEDVTCTAQFQVNQYTMTFVIDNGEENVEKTQDYGTELTAPEDLVKTGFTFKGWEPEVPATIPAGDQTFTAQWERNKYKLTFVVDDVETITEVLYEDPITKPEDPKKEGYTFTGWTPEVPETMPAEDVTCTAQFQVNQYTMTFVLDNGEENMEKKQDYGTELTAPENLVKTGFTFKGWELEVPATIPAGDQTFTAQWERNKYKLTFVVGGVETTTEVLYEDPITKPEDPKKEGYTFNGWDKDIPAKMPAEDVTITAQWAIITYTISYDLAGGELAEDVTNPTSYTVESDDITLANPTHEKYTFAGWTGTDLAEPTLEVKIAKGSIGNRSYTAIWNTTISIDKTTIDSNTVNVYDLHGRIVRRNVPISMLSKELPRGIYIIGGKKVVITK